MVSYIYTTATSIFLINKYFHWYLSIIKNAISQERKRLPKSHHNFQYYELHHIIPKSIDRTLKHDPHNVVLLTAREHFIAHLLLSKMCKNLIDSTKMKRSATYLKSKNGLKVNSRIYEYLKSDLKHSDESKKLMSESQRNRGPRTIEDNMKKSLAAKGKPKSKEHRESLTLAKRKYFANGGVPWNKGLTKEIDPRLAQKFPRSDKTRKKLSDALKGKKRPYSAENGKKGAAKQKETIKDRKRIYNSDGTWHWSTTKVHSQTDVAVN